MYPTNYMNPMNNQPMSPDYGYNRMQQVQQMQQAINPTVPNMFGQMNQMNNMNQLQISIGGTTYPVYTRTGNLLRADQIRCRRVYPIIFGNDPNHFSLLCCVPNTVYTPPVVVPTEG